MTPERWQQIKSTLSGALDCEDTRQRSAFLDDACRNDADLRKRVQTLLDQPDDEFDTFAETLGLVAEESPSRQRIGAYELVRALGRGGMGAVWLARRADHHFDKLVAIKLLKRGTDTDEVLRRFRAERQILARLEHPNIARLLDAGTTDDDLPYFVMEYVDGRRLTDFVCEHKLSLAERLRLFLKICGAVQFAHQNLVVHRDLKPGNILVTAGGEPKLLDFGVAKLLGPGDDALLMTIPGEERFTAAYASPEQVRGEPVTTLSDVYSAGTLLYEMLTGQQAHRFNMTRPPPTELLHVVTQETPPRPSAVATDAAMKRRLRGDLDNIIFKALRKDPARRYPAMGTFAEDIRRYLDDRPVTAGGDTLAYRASKFVQRNKLGVAAAVVVLLSLIGGIIGIAFEAQIANRRFNDVRQLAHSVLFDYHDAIANLPGSTAVRKKILSDSLQYLERLEKQSRGDEALAHEIAAGYLKVGDAQGRPYYPSLGDTAGAFSSYKNAAEIFDRLAARRPDDRQLQCERVTAYTRVSEIERDRNQLDAALNSARRAVEIAEAAQAPSANDDVRETLANAYITLADVRGHPFSNNFGDAKGAMELYARALSLREANRAAQPEDTERARVTAVAHSRVGDVLSVWKDNAGALQHYKAELALDETLLAAAPNDVVRQRAVAVDLSVISSRLMDKGDVGQARELLARSIALNEQIANVDPQNAEAQSLLATAYSKMIPLVSQPGDSGAAREFYDKAVEIYTKQLAKEPENINALFMLRATNARMAESLLAATHAREALSYAQRSVGFAEQAVSRGTRPETRRFLAHSLLQRARIFSTVSDWSAARADYERGLKLLESLPENARVPPDETKRDEANQGLANCEAHLVPIENRR